MTQDADSYYGEEETGAEELDLSFLDDEETTPDTKTK
jgi:hypothetical protein